MAGDAFKDRRPVVEALERMWAQAVTAMSSVEDETARVVQRAQTVAGWSQDEVRRQMNRLTERLVASGGLEQGLEEWSGVLLRLRVPRRGVQALVSGDRAAERLEKLNEELGASVRQLLWLMRAELALRGPARRGRLPPPSRPYRARSRAMSGGRRHCGPWSGRGSDLIDWCSPSAPGAGLELQSGRSRHARARAPADPLSLASRRGDRPGRSAPRARRLMRSAGDPALVRPTGPAVTREEMAADPALCVRLGIRYLRSLQDRFGGDLSMALMAYNAGPDRIRQALRERAVDPFRFYPRRVKRDFQRFRTGEGLGGDWAFALRDPEPAVR